MMKNFSFFLGLAFLFFTSCEEPSKTSEATPQDQASNLSVIDHVDPFIGTGGHGHTYPGASAPFGMIQLSPDNGRSGWDWSSGYHYSDSLIAGFSHLHLSGTGIGDLNDILFMPVNKEIDLTTVVKEMEDIPYLSRFSHDKETAEPGYYNVHLSDYEIDVALTTSQRTGYHSYTFKEGDSQSLIIDLGFTINWDKPVSTSIKLEDENTVSGYRHSTGWANNQKVFFVAEFSKPISEAHLFSNLKKTDEKQVSAPHTSGQLFFKADNNRELRVKVALSSVSLENAKENLEQNATFEKVRETVAEEWNNELAAIEIETSIDSLKTIFYTALYHTKLAPVTFSDANGQFRLENDSIVTAKDFTAYSTLSLWDTFRAEHPLLTLTNPELVSDVINSMMAYYQVDKSLPVWTLYGNETNTMTGYHSIPVIVEAYFKGIRDYDVEAVYEAMKTTMMQDARGLEHYKKYGYIPFDKIDESVTITLEYAYNDWCVAQMAKELGKQEDYEYFLNRSYAFEHLFDPETGFMRGKSSDGKSWNEPFDPKHSHHREKTDYTEGNAWQHSWFVLHDTDKFIELHGGPEKFTSRLEQLFTESSEITGENVSVDISGLIGQYAHGNEPSHHIAYLYNRAGKPWKTQYWVRHILDTQYNTTPNGLSGNEDAGQMSAWYVFSSMGLYPFDPISAQYEIGSPLFEKSTINLKNGKKFTIKANNVSADNFYIQSAKLNGEVYDKSFITHQDILEGGSLEFEMSDTPNKEWATGKSKQN